MKTVVEIESLPIIDPKEDARRIVWEGFADTYSDFEHWRPSDLPAPWPFNGDYAPPLVDMLVGPRVTFVSPEANEWLTAMEAQMEALRAELFYSMETYSVPQHHLWGGSEA